MLVVEKEQHKSESPQKFKMVLGNYTFGMEIGMFVPDLLVSAHRVGFEIMGRVKEEREREGGRKEGRKRKRRKKERKRE